MSAQNEIQPLYSEVEAARLLGIKPRVLRIERLSGRLEYKKIAGIPVYSCDHIIIGSKIALQLVIHRSLIVGSYISSERSPAVSLRSDMRPIRRIGSRIFSQRTRRNSSSLARCRADIKQREHINRLFVPITYAANGTVQIHGYSSSLMTVCVERIRAMAMLERHHVSAAYLARRIGFSTRWLTARAAAAVIPGAYQAGGKRSQ
jgi:hypothetical protein